MCRHSVRLHNATSTHSLSFFLALHTQPLTSGPCTHSLFFFLPLQVAAREAVRAAVEEALGLQLGLMVEFTGLICWRPGSSIGWHHDANR